MINLVDGFSRPNMSLMIYQNVQSTFFKYNIKMLSEIHSAYIGEPKALDSALNLIFLSSAIYGLIGINTITGKILK